MAADARGASVQSAWREAITGRYYPWWRRFWRKRGGP
jgi:hypothetical protein